MDFLQFLETPVGIAGGLTVLIGFGYSIIRIIKGIANKWFNIKFKTKQQSDIDNFKEATANFEVQMENEIKRLDENHAQCSNNIFEQVIEYMEEFKLQIDEGFKEVNGRLDKSEEKYEAGVERTSLILTGLTATLRAQKDGKVNGEVTDALAKLEKYKSDNSSK